MKHFDVYRIVTTVYSRSAKAFETLKRRVLWCSLVLFTSEVFAKKTKTELVFSQSQSLRRLCRCFSSPTDDVHAVQLHDEIVHTWMCLPLHFCCVRAAAEWANEHLVKCRPSCVLTGTGGVPQRSHFRTHWVLCTVLWSSVIYSVFVTKQRLIAP